MLSTLLASVKAKAAVFLFAGLLLAHSAVLASNAVAVGEPASPNTATTSATTTSSDTTATATTPQTPAIDVYVQVTRTSAERVIAWKALGMVFGTTAAIATGDNTPANTTPVDQTPKLADVQIDASMITKLPATVQLRTAPTNKPDLVGGVGGAGSGETATADERDAFYDALNATALVKLLRDTHAAFKGADPENTRPVYADKSVVTEAYQNWTGRADAEPCKGSVVQEAVFATPSECMSGKLDPANLPKHAGIPVLRRRGACTYTSVRCIAPKAAMFTVDALERQVKEQFGERRGEFWYSGRTFAKRETVDALYLKMFPDMPLDPKIGACMNKGLDEFGTDYSAGAWIAIFANSTGCLPGQTPAAGTQCHRIAVDCLGKPTPETVAAVKAAVTVKAPIAPAGATTGGAGLYM